MSHHDMLRFDDVTVCYGRRPAVHHLTGELPCGSLGAIVGPNGAGKSTLLKAVLGWLPLTTGTITLSGRPVPESLHRIAYLHQQDASSAGFPVTVAEVVAMGRYPRLGLWRGFGAEDHAAVDAALAEMNLGELRTRPYSQLSGGQRQRTLLARALATGADVFLLDEPLTGLDLPSQHDLLERLAAWAERGRLVAVVLHDLGLARRWCSHALVLSTHRVACGPISAALCDANLQAAFGRILRGAEMPEPDCERSGDPPHLTIGQPLRTWKAP
jgi:ABC-type Mn2+/Zn2+ transport system ATPase subunit